MMKRQARNYGQKNDIIPQEISNYQNECWNSDLKKAFDDHVQRNPDNAPELIRG